MSALACYEDEEQRRMTDIKEDDKNAGTQALQRGDARKRDSSSDDGDTAKLLV